MPALAALRSAATGTSKWTSLSAHDPLSGLRVAYIPNADDHEPTRHFRKLTVGALRRAGLRVNIVDLAHAGRDMIARGLEECEVIWVAGGNSFYLLQELRRSGAGQLIARLVDRGKTYVGVSAGAVVASPDIAYIEPMDSRQVAPELNDTKGLSLTGFRIIPHVGNALVGRAAKAIKAKESELHPMHDVSDAEALIVDDGDVHRLNQRD
jgi:dipeptidase E